MSQHQLLVSDATDPICSWGVDVVDFAVSLDGRVVLLLDAPTGAGDMGKAVLSIVMAGNHSLCARELLN